MNPNACYLGFALLTLALGAPPSRAAEPAATGDRQTLSLDQGWRFHLGEVAEGQKPGLSDADWRTVDVPHDFSIEGPPGADPATMDGPFDRKSPGGTSARALNGGIAWYRKTFTLPDATHFKEVSVQFDGVYMDSDVLAQWCAPAQAALRLYQFSGRSDAALEAGQKRPGGPGQRPTALLPLVFRGGHLPACLAFDHQPTARSGLGSRCDHAGSLAHRGPSPRPYARRGQHLRH